MLSHDRSQQPWPVLITLVLIVSAALQGVSLFWHTGFALMQALSTRPGAAQPPPQWLVPIAVAGLLVAAALVLARLVLPNKAEETTITVWLQANAPWLLLLLVIVIAVWGATLGGLTRPLVGHTFTTWRWPHLAAGLGTGVALLLAVWLLRRMASPAATLLQLVALAFALESIYRVAVLDWEVPGGLITEIGMRPLWAYVSLAGGIAVLVLLLARAFTRWAWAATVVALLFYLLRIGVVLLLGANGNPGPFYPLIVLVGALLLDWWPRRRVTLPPVATALLDGLLFGVGFLAVALPVLFDRPFAARPDTMAMGIAAVVSLFVSLAVAIAAYALTGQLNQAAAAPETAT